LWKATPEQFVKCWKKKTLRVIYKLDQRKKGFSLETRLKTLVATEIGTIFLAYTYHCLLLRQCFRSSLSHLFKAHVLQITSI